MVCSPMNRSIQSLQLPSPFVLRQAVSTSMAFIFGPVLECLLLGLKRINDVRSAAV